MQLLLQATWDVPDTASLLLVQERAFNLIDLFQECASSSLPFSCPYDFSASDGGWTALADDSSLTPAPQAVYVPGSFWQNNVQIQSGTGFQLERCRIEKSYSPGVNVSSVVMTYDLVKGSTLNPGLSNDLACFSGGTLVGYTHVNSDTDPDGLSKTLTVTFGTPTSVDLVVCQVNDYFGTPGGTPGTSKILNTEVDGVGSATC
jgi:hypothetical protein